MHIVHTQIWAINNGKLPAFPELESQLGMAVGAEYIIAAVDSGDKLLAGGCNDACYKVAVAYLAVQWFVMFGFQFLNKLMLLLQQDV